MATKNLQMHASKTALSALCAAAGLLGVHCGFGPEPVSNATGGTTGSPTTTTGGNNASPTTPMAGASNTTNPVGGASNPAGGQNPGGGAGTVAGAGGSGGGAPPDPAAGSYTVTGTWPNRPVAIATKPGTLTYTKVEIHSRFLAESCSIADYDKDGIPDISAGRRWWKGPIAPGTPGTEYIFRGGHDDLPRDGLSPELVTGVSDDWACYAQDVDSDGWTDIINIASADVDENQTPSKAPQPQAHATAFWYKNPGATAAGAMWQPYQIHPDVRHEQHGLVDVNGDGKPEIYGACKGCDPVETKGYYQMDPANPTAGWQYRAVTARVEFPFSGTGWLHGLGFGDVNKDGTPDLITREGVWTNAMAAAPDMNAFIQTQLYGGGDGGQLGGSHMHAADMDGDGDNDIIGAELAHNYGVAWYEQTTPGTFVKHRIAGTPQDGGITGIVFSQPHALEVVDMDGDGQMDIVTGKMRFAHPDGYGDPDLGGDPVSYVFQFKHATPPASGMVTITAKPLDTSPVGQKAGVGRQIAVGHINTDGIMDVCVSSKVGLYVYLGQ